MSSSPTQPSALQLKAIVEFMEKHPQLANTGSWEDLRKPSTKRLWTELKEIIDFIPGISMSVKGLMMFWIQKKSEINAGNDNHNLDNNYERRALDDKIRHLCPIKKYSQNKHSGKNKMPVSSDSDDDIPLKRKKFALQESAQDMEERHQFVMQKLVETMENQATALSQLAQASLTNAQATNRLAEASLIQAQALERLSRSFERIGTAAVDVKNAIINIDYSIKRGYSLNSLNIP